MDEKTIEKAIDADSEVAAEVLGEAMFNPDVSTYKVYEEMACRYLGAENGFRKGMDYALSMVAGLDMTDLAKLIIAAEQRKEACNG